MTDKAKNRKSVPVKDTGAILPMDVKDRLFFGAFLPKEASKLDQVIARDIIKKIELTQKDIVDFKIATKDERTTWNKEGMKKRKIRFSNPEVEFLQKQSARVSTEKKVTQETLSLCERIDDLNKKIEEQEE